MVSTATDSPSTQRVAALKRPAAYPDATTAVTMIETHISWIFLTDRFAYKLKKPVHFEFLDFRSVAARRTACEEELRLNRRLAPGVYHSVVPLFKTPTGLLNLRGPGEPVDWLVRMARLPAAAALDVLIRDGRHSTKAIQALAGKLAAFYDQLPPVTITVDEYRSRLQQQVAANGDALRGVPELEQAVVRRVQAAQQRLLRIAPAWFDDRVRDGRIVEGHGDLRPEHIYFTPAPVVIDCLEFSRELRTLDVADELAFLTVEADLLAHDQSLNEVLRQYTQLSGDRIPPRLFDFYMSYRATVRAKVNVLRAEQLTGDERADRLQAAAIYLETADRCAASFGKTTVLLIHGLPGTGKSTLAGIAHDELGGELIQSDAVRRQLFGATSGAVGFGEGPYRPENRDQVYAEMLRQMETALKQRVPVVLDATYSRAAQRAAVTALAEAYNAAVVVVRCECPDDVARERIDSRRRLAHSLSQTRPEFLARHRQETEPDPPSHQPALVVDTTSSSVEPLQAIYRALGQVTLSAPAESSSQRSTATAPQ